MTSPVVNWYQYYKFAYQPQIQYFPLPPQHFCCLILHASSSFSNLSHGKLPEQGISFGSTNIPLWVSSPSFFYAFNDANIFINLQSYSMQNKSPERIPFRFKVHFPLFWKEFFSSLVLFSLLDTVLLLPRTWQLQQHMYKRQPGIQSNLCWGHVPCCNVWNHQAVSQRTTDNGRNLKRPRFQAVIGGKVICINTVFM